MAGVNTDESNPDVNVVASVLPTGASTSALQTSGNSSLTSIDNKTPALVSGRQPVDGSGVTQPVSGPLTDTQLRASAVPVIANAGTNLNTSALALESTQTAQSTLYGAVTETAPATDTVSSGLNGRLQRIAQRISALITASTDRSQKTQITNGTIDAAVTSGVVGLSDNALAVRPVPYEPQTYSAGASAFVPAATATDVFLISGSATKVIRIHKINVSGTTTSGSPIKCTINLIKRSTANTGGTSVVSTNVPHDTSNAAASAVARSYTVNPTVGTQVGIVRSVTNSFQAAGLTVGSIDFDFNNDGGQPVILRGVAENLAVNLNSTTITGGVISVSVEWSEV